MTREEAIETIRMCCPKVGDSQCDFESALRELIPELAESEDERIRQMIENTLRDAVLSERISDTSYREMSAYLEKQKEPEDKGEISDGYHTFNELYYYRMLYNAAFFNLLPKEWVHKSKRHHDGEECFGGGWFIVMANLPTGQISNHYELKDWDLFQIPEKEIADEWDGHTPQEAAERIHEYLLEKQKEQKPNYCHYNGGPSVERCKYCSFACSARLTEEQKPAEWSEEDKKMLDLVISNYKYMTRKLRKGDDSDDVAGDIEVFSWLESLPERFNLQPKPEWSEEDEKRIQRICDFLWKNRKGDTDTIYQIEKDVDWLKPLRPSWKPSEEQIGALQCAIVFMEIRKASDYDINPLKSIYEQLKKLM